jgi:hypothetical protein
MGERERSSYSIHFYKPPLIILEDDGLTLFPPPLTFEIDFAIVSSRMDLIMISS